MQKIFLYATYPCERRPMDAMRLKNYFVTNGHKIVNKPEEANIIIFLTCAALDIDTENSLDRLKEFQKYNAEIIVGGCLPSIDKEKLAKIFNGRTFDTKDLNRNLDKFDGFFPENKIKLRDFSDANTLDLHPLFQESCRDSLPKFLKKIFKKSKELMQIYTKINYHALKYIFQKHSFFYSPLLAKTFFIRISWGCNFNCTFCAINKAVGPLHSKTVDQCLIEFKKGLKEGYKNFIITADDTGSYGMDVGSSLPELLDKMTNIQGSYNIEIRDLNPVWLVKYINDFEKILKRHKISRIIIPIQSGNSRILKLMNRYSDIEKMKEAFSRLKKADSNLVLLTNFIVGFPTENEEEFKDTLTLIKEINFDSGLIYLFSCKQGTKAEKMEGKLSDNEKFQRLKQSKKFLVDIGYYPKVKRGSYCIIYGKRLISLD